MIITRLVEVVTLCLKFAKYLRNNIIQNMKNQAKFEIVCKYIVKADILYAFK